MTDEMLNQEEEFDAVAEIQKLKENMVSRDDYEKLKRENGKLMKTLISGGQVKDESKKTAEEMRKALYTDYEAPKTNLAFVSTLLDLRDAEIAAGHQDIFVANGKDYTPTQNDFAEAENVANVLRKCVDDCNGDSDTFNDMIRRYMR